MGAGRAPEQATIRLRAMVLCAACLIVATSPVRREPGPRHNQSAAFAVGLAVKAAGDELATMQALRHAAIRSLPLSASVHLYLSTDDAGAEYARAGFAPWAVRVRSLPSRRAHDTGRGLLEHVLQHEAGILSDSLDILIVVDPTVRPAAATAGSGHAPGERGRRRAGASDKKPGARAAQTTACDADPFLLQPLFAVCSHLGGHGNDTQAVPARWSGTLAAASSFPCPLSPLVLGGLPRSVLAAAAAEASLLESLDLSHADAHGSLHDTNVARGGSMPVVAELAAGLHAERVALESEDGSSDSEWLSAALQLRKSTCEAIQASLGQTQMSGFTLANRSTAEMDTQGQQFVPARGPTAAGAWSAVSQFLSSVQADLAGDTERTEVVGAGGHAQGGEGLRGQLTIIGQAGRLGNWLFRVGSGLGLAWDSGKALVLPEALPCLVWHEGDPEPPACSFRSSFLSQIRRVPTLDSEAWHALVDEPSFAYAPSLLPQVGARQNVALRGYLQSFRYFHHHRDRLRRTLMLPPRAERHARARFRALLAPFLPSRTATLAALALHAMPPPPPPPPPPGDDEREGGADGDWNGDILRELVPVAMHVRRTDYAQYPAKHPMLTRDYYEQALQVLEGVMGEAEWRKRVLLVFCDDVRWCAQQQWVAALGGPRRRLVVVPGDAPDFVDLRVMSLCRFLVIANSSFSW